MFLRRFLCSRIFKKGEHFSKVVAQGYGSKSLSQSTCSETAETGSKTGLTLRLLRCTAKTAPGARLVASGRVLALRRTHGRVVLRGGLRSSFVPKNCGATFLA